MITVFKQNDGSFIIPMELPEPSNNKDDVVNDRQEVIKLAKIMGLKIDYVKWGYRIFKAVLVPGTEEEFRAYIGEEDRRQKAQRVNGRCPVPDGRGGIMRCPERLQNPEYDEKTNPDVPKTISNDCATCVYNTFSKPDYTTTTFSKLEQTDEDGDVLPFEVEVGMMPDSWKFEMAKKIILDMVKEKHPERYDDMALRLEEYTRSEVADALDMNKSTVYKLGVDLTKDLYGMLDSLWFLDIDKYL